MDHLWTSPKFQLSPPILETIENLGFASATPVQMACIPLLKNYKDVAAEAVTGSGKTLAFVIPTLEILLRREEKLKKKEIGAVIITPTQELAIQIHGVVEKFLENLPRLSCLLFIGGSNPIEDLVNFKNKGGNVLISTPGRLDDLLSRKENGFDLAASIKTLEILILDEADRLLEMGFKNSLDSILSRLPKQRRTGLFSATQTKEVENLIRAGLRNPVIVTIREKNVSRSDVQKTPATLRNYYLICEADEKLNFLISFLRKRTNEKLMVFFNTCACVDYFTSAVKQFVKRANIVSIHSKMKNKRGKVFRRFQQLDRGILICTDVMARGIDFPEIDWVVQYDAPGSASSFVHRCGRTARIGNSGNALLMLMPHEDTYINFLNINQKVSLQRMNLEIEENLDVLPKLKKMATKDRAVFDKGNRAFVSYIQAYSKHECSLIFRVKDLDIGKLAEGFALLRLPRMPELKDKTFPNFQAVEINVNQIPYSDKQREKIRKTKLKIYEETGQWPTKKQKLPRKKTAPWSKSKIKKQQQKETKKLRRDRKRKTMNDDEDLDDLARDTGLMKRLKKGKISKEEFDNQFDIKELTGDS